VRHSRLGAALLALLLSANLSHAGVLTYYLFDQDYSDESGNANHLTVAVGTPTISTRAGELVFAGAPRDAVATMRCTGTLVSNRYLQCQQVRPNDQTASKGRCSDAEIDVYERTSGETSHHPSCTCKMGYDDMAVVDREGRVHGVENLRVVDASIMPKVVTPISTLRP
jgi:choline dehydrogenase-like flavoprotein